VAVLQNREDTLSTPGSKAARPNFVGREEWERARAELLAVQKATTRAEDAVAARRRRLPMVQFRSDYLLAAPNGRVSFLDLFRRREQLRVYQFMGTGQTTCAQVARGSPISVTSRIKRERRRRSR